MRIKHMWKCAFLSLKIQLQSRDEGVASFNRFGHCEQKWRIRMLHLHDHKHNGGAGKLCSIYSKNKKIKYSRANNIRYDDGFSQFCAKLGRLEPICLQYSTDLGSFFQEAFELGNTVDSLCYCMGECYVSEGHRYCSFFPEKEDASCPENTKQVKQTLSEMKELNLFCMEGPENFAICKGFASFGFEDWLEEVVDRLDRHVPAIDDDGDLFGLRTGGARGFWWRGKDCIDQDETIYPGQPPIRGDRFVDANCNGISGMENDVSIEDTYCGDSGAIGVAVLGDSAGAHFSIPEVWFTPHLWTEESMPFKDAEIALANELDWPQLSWITGFKGNCWETGPKSWVEGKYVDSIYSRLVERNRCNLNDFINQANNGCKSSSMADKTIFGLGRKPLDKPMLVFLSLVGNDVCNTKINTEEYMTTPERFYEKTLESLQYLESILPEGSAVVVTGLAQGELLFEILGLF
jgi:acyloxyacyl hydrolase